MLYTDWKTFLPELNLAYCDKLSMAASVETRVPYLDNEIVDFMCTVPVDLKLHGLTSKYLLREAMRISFPRPSCIVARPGSERPSARGCGATCGRWSTTSEPGAYRCAGLLRRRRPSGA